MAVLWPSAAFLAIAIVLAIVGRATLNRPGSADEKMGALIPFALAAFFALAGILWWIVAVTIKAFG